MFIYPIYKAIKTRLGPDVPVFFFIDQYKKGKDNTSYVVPAIYVEFPKDMRLDFYPRKLMTSKNVPIKIHYISHAPFKNHDNAIQEAAIAAHEDKLKDIDRLTNGWNVADIEGNKLTEQLIPGNASLLNFQDVYVISVITYPTEIYSRHLMTDITV